MKKQRQGNPIIIIVDDDALRSTLDQALKAADFDLLVANADRDVSDLLLTNRVMVVIVDFNLRSANSRELVQLIRNVDPTLQCIVCAEASNIETAYQMMQGQVYDFVTVPIDGDRLERMVMRAAEHTALLRQQKESEDMFVQRLEQLSSRLNALHDADAQLIRTSKAVVMEQFAEGLRHELGNALTVIRLNMTLLMTYRENVNAFTRHMNSLEQGVQAIERITLGLRDFPVGESGNSESLDLSNILVQAAEQTRQTYNISANVLHFDLVASAPAQGNLIQLTRAFESLITNAIEATLNASTPDPVIAITLRADGDQWKVTVQDNGVGLTAEALAHALEPGYTTKIERGFMRGLGLGLFMTDTILYSHGGRLRLSNLAEGGTLVEAWLPRTPLLPGNAV